MFTNVNALLSTEGQSLTSTSLNASRGTGDSNSAVGVWHAGQATARKSGLDTTEVVALVGGAAGVVDRVDGLLSTGPDVVLDEDLGTLANVDTISNILEDVVEEMGSAEAQGRSTRVDVEPVVVDVGDVHLASVLSGVVVGVANQGCLVVVVELAVADSDPVNGVGQVEEAIVEVLAAVHVAGEIDVVDPDIGGLLNGDSITAVGNDLGDLEVADDDVLLRLDGKTEANEF